MPTSAIFMQHGRVHVHIYFHATGHVNVHFHATWAGVGTDKDMDTGTDMYMDMTIDMHISERN